MPKAGGNEEKPNVFNRRFDKARDKVRDKVRDKGLEDGIAPHRIGFATESDL